MIIDFGAHLHPNLDFFETKVPFQNFAPLLNEADRNPKKLLEGITSAGIDGAVLSQPYLMGHENLDEVREANDALLEIIDDYDEFYGLATIPLVSGSKAAEELERCLSNGYNGGSLETRIHEKDLADESLDPVFEAAEKQSAPVLVHPTIPNSILDEGFQLNQTFGREVDLCESIFKVIHGGLLDRHPDLKLVFHHLGGNIASMMGRIELRLTKGRWPDQEDIKPFYEFKVQLERIYLDTSGFFGYHAPLRTSLEEFPATQLVFGTDYPYEPRDPEEYKSFAKTVKDVTPEKNSKLVLGENATNLLINI